MGNIYDESMRAVRIAVAKQLSSAHRPLVHFQPATGGTFWVATEVNHVGRVYVATEELPSPLFPPSFVPTTIMSETIQRHQGGTQSGNIGRGSQQASIRPSSVYGVALMTHLIYSSNPIVLLIALLARLP